MISSRQRIKSLLQCLRSTSFHIHTGRGETMEGGHMRAPETPSFGSNTNSGGGAVTTPSRQRRESLLSLLLTSYASKKVRIGPSHCWPNATTASYTRRLLIRQRCTAPNPMCVADHVITNLYNRKLVVPGCLNCYAQNVW